MKKKNNFNVSTTQKSKNKKIASIILIILMVFWSLGSILSFYNTLSSSKRKNAIMASADEVQLAQETENSSYVKIPLKMIEQSFMYDRDYWQPHTVYGLDNVYILFPLNSAEGERRVTLLYGNGQTFTMPYTNEPSSVEGNFGGNSIGNLYNIEENSASVLSLNTISYYGVVPINGLPSSVYVQGGAFHFGNQNNKLRIYIDINFIDSINHKNYYTSVTMFFSGDFVPYAVGMRYSNANYIQYDKSYIYGGSSDSSNEAVYQQTIIQQQTTIDTLNSELKAIQLDFNRLNNDHNRLRDAYNAVITERDAAYDNGYLQGQIVGYNNGFADGVETSDSDRSFFGLMSAIVDAPIQALEGLLSFSVFGTDMTDFVFSLIAVAFIIAIIRIFI